MSTTVSLSSVPYCIPNALVPSLPSAPAVPVFQPPLPPAPPAPHILPEAPTVTYSSVPVSQPEPVLNAHLSSSDDSLLVEVSPPIVLLTLFLLSFQKSH